MARYGRRRKRFRSCQIRRPWLIGEIEVSRRDREGVLALVETIWEEPEEEDVGVGEIQVPRLN